MQITPDDALFLRTIGSFFHLNGVWPTLHWLEREFLGNREIDVAELEYRLTTPALFSEEPARHVEELITPALASEARVWSGCSP